MAGLVTYRRGVRWKGWQVVVTERPSLGPLFTLDYDGNRHAEPVHASYLRTAGFRFDRDTGTILFGSRDLCLASICC